jgi:DNA replication protein
LKGGVKNLKGYKSRGDAMDKVVDRTSGFNYTIIDNYILDSQQLNAMEQIIYIHLKKYASSNVECFPGLPSLSSELNCSENTVRSHLRKLQEKGFITIEQRFNSSNIYTLLPYPEYVAEQETKDQITGVVNLGIGEVLKVYQNNINPTYGSMERDKLIKWFEEFKENAEVIIKSIEIAVGQGARKIKFIETILIDWKQNGISTLEQAEAYTKLREEKKRGGKGGSTGENTGASTSELYDFSKYGG